MGTRAEWSNDWRRAGIGFGTVDSYRTHRSVAACHNFVAIGRRLTPWLGGELSLFLLQMDEWTAEAGRSLAINCNSLVIAVALTAVYAVD